MIIMIDFTKEELFFIEQEFDVKASILHKRLTKIVELFMLLGVVPEENKEISEEMRRMIMKEIQELHRCIDLTKSIRDKLERQRLNA